MHHASCIMHHALRMLPNGEVFFQLCIHSFPFPNPPNLGILQLLVNKEMNEGWMDGIDGWMD